MSFNSAPSLESGPSLKDQAIAAYKKFIERGATNPDDLDLNDLEVKEAHELFYAWQVEEDTKAQGDREKEHEANFAKTIFYVDAGFTDPVYLEDVLDWLNQDLQNVEEEADEPLPEVAAKIKAKIAEIEAMLGNK
jgi:hypothetical protein